MTATGAAGGTLEEFQPLSAAEQLLVDACARGTGARLSSQRPAAATSTNKVRASVVAFLAQGGDDATPVHHQGLQLYGAWIEGVLDLEASRIDFPLAMRSCHLEEKPSFRDTVLGQGLVLTNSRVPGMDMDGLSVRADVYMEQLQSAGQIRMLGARIGGDLVLSAAQLDGLGAPALAVDRAIIDGGMFFTDGFAARGQVRSMGTRVGADVTFSSAQINGLGGIALGMDRAVVEGNVFLTDRFTAQGQVRLLGAQIMGNLECDDATFNGQGDSALALDGALIKGDVSLEGLLETVGAIQLTGAQIGGDLNCSRASFDSKKSIVLERARVAGTWFLRKLPQGLQQAQLQGLFVQGLDDDVHAWGAGHRLDGFAYGHFAGSAPADAASRIAWLCEQESGCLGKDEDKQRFRPQPWHQLQKVFREAGHFEGARQVAIALERHRRTHGLIGQTPEDWSKVHRGLYVGTARILHRAFGVLLGYGHRPSRLLGWMVGVWLGCAAIYWAAALGGAFGPTQPLVFNDPRFASCRPNWYLCEALPEEYAGFSPLAYSLDVLLPVVNLQQETEWAPLIPTPRTPWWSEFLGHWSVKHFTRLLVWFEILFGWVASLLMVAVVSGLTKRRDE